MLLLPFVGPESARKRLPVSSNSFAYRFFHAITFERKVFSKIHESKSKKSLRETREYRCLLVSTDAEAARVGTDGYTHRQTDTHDNESTKVQNPRRNSYAGITPCIEQQVPHQQAVYCTAHARRVPVGPRPYLACFTPVAPVASL